MSYRIESADGKPTLQTITKSIGDWWDSGLRDRRLALAANAGSNTISSLTVLPSGELQLFAPIAASTASGTMPIDMAVARDGRFLYVICLGNGSVTGCEVQNGRPN